MRRFRWLTGLALVAGLCGALSVPALAQTCGEDYTMQDGDSLAKIATKVYGKSSQWTLIFYANQDRFGAGQTLLTPGLIIRIPCIGSAAAKGDVPAIATTLAATPSTQLAISSEIKRIQFLTATDFPPFTDSSLPNGGMITDVVNAAMGQFKKAAGADFDYSISWVNDWAAHLNPLLSSRAFDLGFPWYKPNCAAFEDLDTNAKFRCQKFFFSNPVFEEQVLIFLKKDSPIKFENDNEMVGKKLCRPSGYWTFDLDDQGRNWIKEKKVVLLSPPTVEECMRLLADGSVDAVPINELTGRSAMVRLDLTSKLRIVDKPLSILTLHVIVAKTHPNARTLLYYINTALDRLKASGNYDQIVEKHLQQFWDAQAEQAAPKAKAVEAPQPVKPADAKAAAGTVAAAASTAEAPKK